MCGICGYYGRDYQTSREDLISMASTMIHRGPDDSGLYLEEGCLGLGHRRLSIIDLSPAGRQPMVNERETVYSITNGEIYNYSELKSELEGLGHRFRGRCDAEVIPHAYEEWGLDFPKKLRGMFALALWDKEARCLVLVRDRLGIKPLYYYDDGRAFLFASELKGLMAHPFFAGEIDRENLYLYLAFGYVPSPKTIFGRTAKLPPGNILVLEFSGTTLHRYWDPLEAGKGRDLPDDEEGLLETLDGELRRSIGYRLISDVPLGAFLSGGIDSSLTVSLMARLASGPVRTFTIGFWEKDYDEARYARRVAERLGTEHTELYVEPRDALEVIPLLPGIYDEPFGDYSAIPTYLVSKLARESVTVALSGDGGDELFCGYPRYYWSHLAKRLGVLPPGLRRFLTLPVGWLPHPKAKKAASWLGYKDLIELYFGVVGIWDQGRLQEVLGFERPFADLDFETVYRAAEDRPFLEKLMLVDLFTYLPEDILTKVDRASMAHSLEVRVPLLDHSVVELALALPLKMKFRRRQGKYLIKKLLGRYLPPALFERPKMGFSVPLEHWFRKELKSLLLEYTDAGRLKREGFFDHRPVTALVREHLDGKRNHQYLLWVLLMFQMWHEKYFS